MSIDNNNLFFPPAKLNHPPIGRQWIERPRLLEALDESLGGKLTLISAPAGYGKTTLVLQWLNHISCHSAWLSLDKSDSTPDRFLYSLIATIRGIFPHFDSQTSRLLSAQTLPPPEYLVDVFIHHLAALNTPLVLAIDDFHLITSEDVHKMIKRVVQYMPKGLHLIIATRIDPPLPIIQWQIKQWLSKLNAADLRFVDEEAKAFFNPVKSELLTINTMEQIVTRTEGWAVGLQLILLDLLKVDSPQAFAEKLCTENDMVIEYIFEEVIACQPDDVKLFLSISAIPDSFCVSLCDYLLAKEGNSTNSRRIINYLIKNNLFIVPLDNENRWYRYHHQFQEMLRLNIRSAIPSIRQTKTHQMAGEWYADHGYFEDALKHLIAAENIDAAAELVGDIMHPIIDQDISRRALKRLLDMFPNGAEESHPELLIAHTFIKAVNLDFISWASLMDQAELLLKNYDYPIPETRRQSLLGDVAIQRASFLCYQGDFEGSLRRSEWGLKVVPKKHRYSHNMGLIYNSAAKFLCGRQDEALFQLDLALNANHSEGSLNAGQLLVTKMAILTFAADWNAVQENAQKLLLINETVPQGNYWLGYAYYFLGCAAYERNLLGTAADHFSRVIKMRDHVTTRICHDSMISLALITWAKGDVKTTEKYIDEAFLFAIEMKDSFSVQISDSVKSKLALHTGKVSADLPKHTSVGENVFYWLTFPLLLHADILSHMDDHKHSSDALIFIDKTLQRLNQYHIRLYVQFQAAKAVALKLVGRVDESFELFEDAIHLAEPRGLVRSFLDRGPIIGELLKVLLKKSPDNPYLHRLMDAFMLEKSGINRMGIASVDNDQLVPAPGAADSTFIDLSNRELDVLILLQERLSNKEIAQKLFISAETVKTHLSSLYRKLKAPNRRQAVNTARKCNLIPERRRKNSSRNIYR
ncbi:LuxR C-terminal-related transcriptional regulator [Desulfogranum marinum]|uniref:LuxR C-terminal-related transcriptional regulator n=1 Tax=Desulfogranum marinum TaxID=453220 RepID=UPI0029C6337B|nr:LuxR C-terminal-related transcriptional regulator [Desulfogranum marinum]